MRIAISGTHFIGKTTLIQDFISLHPEYGREIEPYYKLQEETAVELGVEPTLDSLLEQLDYSIESIHQLAHKPNIIFDRCPLDFIAYSMCALEEQSIDLYDSEVSERFPLVKEALNHLNLIAFIPISRENLIEYTEENPEYRSRADKHFKKLFRDDIYDLFPRYSHPRIIELMGNRTARVKILESYLLK